MTRLVDWRRLALAAPLLAIAGVGLYVLAFRDDASATTPRAMLSETPPGVEDSVGVRKGHLARDFIATSPDGTSVRLSDLRGTPVIVNFWASWCTSCLAEMPEFHELQKRIGVENLHVLAINTGESAETAEEFVEKLGVDSFLVGVDPSLVVADAYGVFGMPTSVFLDAEGVIRATYAGHIPSDTLEEFVASARTGADAAEPDPRLRVVTTVAREHTLEVRDRDGTLDLRSKSLRCDDSHCPDVAGALAGLSGVTRLAAYREEDPARISVDFDSDVIGAQTIVDEFVRHLNEQPDPLYERPLEVIWE